MSLFYFFIIVERAFKRTKTLYHAFEDQQYKLITNIKFINAGTEIKTEYFSINRWKTELWGFSSAWFNEDLYLLKRKVLVSLVFVLHQFKKFLKVARWRFFLFYHKCRIFFLLHSGLKKQTTLDRLLTNPPVPILLWLLQKC